MSRCTGHCCKKFFLPFSYQELLENCSRYEDGPQIASMVIPLGEIDNQFFYTCKWFDNSSNICMIYEDRPKMCKQYPNAKRCMYAEECTAIHRGFDDNGKLHLKTYPDWPKNIYTCDPFIEEKYNIKSVA